MQSSIFSVQADSADKQDMAADESESQKPGEEEQPKEDTKLDFNGNPVVVVFAFPVLCAI